MRECGAVPATIALMEGQIRVGLSRNEMEQIAAPESEPIKVSRRDLANCLARKVGSNLKFENIF